jgi:general stress protein 26
MNRRELLQFIRHSRLGVQASVSASGAPQAAVVGVVVTDELELFFDTLDSTRKCANLRRDARIAFVIGWDDEQTVQYEGVADEPRGAELDRLKARYFEVFTDGPQRQAWPGITYLRTKPRWIRHADYRGAEPKIVEFEGERLKKLLAEPIGA